LHEGNDNRNRGAIKDQLKHKLDLPHRIQIALHGQPTASFRSRASAALESRRLPAESIAMPMPVKRKKAIQVLISILGFVVRHSTTIRRFFLSSILDLNLMCNQAPRVRTQIADWRKG